MRVTLYVDMEYDAELARLFATSSFSGAIQPARGVRPSLVVNGRTTVGTDSVKKILQAHQLNLEDEKKKRLINCLVPHIVR